MQFQRCPSCREKNDVSVYVHGQTTRCARCGIRFQVDRESASSSPAVDKLPSPVPHGPDHKATEISLVRGGVDEIVRTATPMGGVVDPLPPLPSLETPIAIPITSGQLFPTPVQRHNAPERGATAEAPTNAPPVDKSRPNIPGFDCTQLLGRGGMGEVWKAQQLSLARTVAVKLLSPTLAVEPDFVRRFERESTALAALAHPHIVSVFDRGSANGHWYFVMEFVEGKSLRDRLAEGPIARTELMRLMAEVARAVEYAHQKNVVHRDLKPENILVDQLGHAKVADFGLAGMSEVGRSSLTMSAVAMGTAHYMAPEQRKDAKKVDGRADLYSIGVMLYEFMTGELPQGRFQTPREKVPAVDPRLDALILKLLDQDPLKRPERASEVADVLERLVAEEKGERLVVPPPQHTKVLSGVVREVRQNPTKKAMAAGAALLLLLVLILAIAKAGGDGGRKRLSAKVDRPQPGRASVTFGSGSDEALLAVGDGWSVEDGVLRRSSVLVPPDGEPRTYLMALRLDYIDARVEADVIVDELAGARAPRVELAVYSDPDRYVGLRMSLAEDAAYTLFYSAPSKAGKTIRQELEGSHDADPKAGRKYHLELYVVDGRVTAFVDKRQVASAAVSGLNGVKAKAALGCRGECRFTNLRVAGAIAEPPSATNAQK